MITWVILFGWIEVFGLALKASLIEFSYRTAGQLVYTFSRYPDKVIMEKNISGAEHHMFKQECLQQNIWSILTVPLCFVKHKYITLYFNFYKCLQALWHSILEEKNSLMTYKLPIKWDQSLCCSISFSELRTNDSVIFLVILHNTFPYSNYWCCKQLLEFMWWLTAW